MPRAPGRDIRSNQDISWIPTVAKALYLIYYITNYATKDDISPNPSIDSRKDFILNLYLTYTWDHILQILYQEGVQISLRSLKRRLQNWGATKQPDLTVKGDAYSTLVEAVGQLYCHHPYYRDDQIAPHIHQTTSIQTSTLQVKRNPSTNGLATSHERPRC